MSASLYTLSSSSSSTDSLLELNSRERDKTNENNEHMGAYLPSNSLFNSNLYHVTCATCLQISGNHVEHKHGYSQLQPFIFTVCFSFHPDYFDSQTRIQNMQMTQHNHKKFVTTASGSTRTAQPTNEQLIRLQSLAELRRKQLYPWNPHNRCIIPLSHELTHQSRNSKTFSIRTHKRLTRLRRRYNRYLMSRCIQYVTQTCHTYYTKVDYSNEGFQQCQENASYDSHDMTMQVDNYKMANKKRVAVGKRNPDITVLYVGSETRSKPSKPCACACTCAGNDPTDCERNKCPSRNKCCLTNKSGQSSGKYKRMNKKCVTNKKLPEGFDLDTNVLYDGSKSKGKSLQPFERSSGTSAPTDCVPYECYQKFKKIMPYGCNVSIQSGKNVISNVKQESTRKSTAKSVRETVYPCSGTKLNSSQPNKHSTGVNVSTNWDPNQCLQQVKKYTPYGCHASTQSSRYKMLKEKRDTVKPSSAKRGPDTAVPDVAARSQRNAKQPDDSVTMNSNPIDYAPQVKKYTAYGSHVFTQSSQYNMQEQRSSRREPCPEKHSKEKNTNYTKKKLKTFQCDPDTCVYRKVGVPKNSQQANKITITENQKTNQKNRKIQLDSEPSDSAPHKRNAGQRLQQTLKRICKPGDCAFGKCEPKDCYQRIQPTRFDIINACSSSRSSQGSTQTRKDKIPSPKSLKDTSYTKKGVQTTPRHMPGGRQAVNIGSTCSFNVVFYKDITQNGTVLQQSDKKPEPDKTSKKQSSEKKSRKKLNPYECPPGMCVPRKQFDCKPGVCIPGKCNVSKCYQLLTANTRSHVTSRSSGEKKKKGRKVNGGNLIVNKDRSASGMTKHQMHTPNRHADHNTLKCCCHVGFCEGIPQNVFVMNGTPSTQREVINPNECNPSISDAGKCDPAACIQQALEQFYCEHGVCVPGKCFQQMKIADPDGSHTSMSKTHVRDRRLIKEKNTLLYKDKHYFSMPRPMIPLHIPDMQVVRTGSNCSFNFEFYKSLAQNGVGVSEHINEPAKDDHGDTPIRLTVRNTKKREECQRDICDPSTCVEQAVFNCEPGVCISGKCDPNKCLRRIKFTGTDTDADESRGSQASMLKIRQNKRRSLKENSIIYKDIGVFSIPRSKMAFNIFNTKVVNIGSKCGFNIDLYKGLPKNSFMKSDHINEHAYYDQDNTLIQHKPKSREKIHVLNPIECKPGVCAPGKCDPGKCFQRINVNGTDTDSNASYRGSQAYNNKGSFSVPKPNMILQIFNTHVVGIGSKCSCNVEFYKSLPQNGFGMSDQIYQPANPDQVNSVQDNKTSNRNTRQINPFECVPGICVSGKCDPSACLQKATIDRKDCKRGVCVPGKCDPIKCFERLKFSGTDTGSVGSQASMSKTKGQLLQEENSILYKDKGLGTAPRSKMPLQIANRQAVRIGSKCSFNVEFYKSLPQNGFVTSANINEPANYYDQSNTPSKRKTSSSRKTRKEKNPFACEPVVCKPGKCDPIKCFERLKVSGTDTESVGSQASKMSKKRMTKRQLLKEENAILYKDKGFGTASRSKMPLHIESRQTVRIGSKCSFNVEFYKNLPQNGFVTSESINEPENDYDQSNTPSKRKTSSSRKSRKEKNPFECEPGVCKPGKCDPATCAQHALKQLNCNPGLCVPGKCDPIKCFERLKVSGTDTESIGSQASKMSKKRMTKGQLLKEENSILYKDKGFGTAPRSKMPLHIENRQTVRIGSKCSFNIELYKSLPQNGLVTSEQSNQSTKYDQGDTSTRRKGSSRKKNRVLKPYECQPGVCIPRKCDPDKCLQQLKASGRDTNVITHGSQAYSRAGRKNKGSKRNQGNEFRSKDSSVSSSWGPMMPTHKPKHTVRVESGLKFNAELYKSLPPNGVVKSAHSNLPEKYDQGDTPNRQKPSSRKKKRALKPYQCQPGVCIPRKCDPDKCLQQLKASDTDTNTYNATSRGSLPSSKSDRRKKRRDLHQGNGIISKDASVASMSRPTMPSHKQKHTVRIGSTLSFNVELYKSLPPKGVATSENMASSLKNPYACKPGICVPGKCDPGKCSKHDMTEFECQPGVCIPGKCDVGKCFQRLKISGTDTTVSNATSRGSQAYAKTLCVCRKKKGLTQDEGNGFRYKDQGAYSMRVPKMRVPQKQSFRIGSKCSFNIEFYKALPQNNFVRNISALSDQGDTPSRRKEGQVLNPFECKPGICVPGKCDPGVCAKHGLTGFECQPGLCIPGKCDVAKCFQNLNRNLKQDKQFECEPGVCAPGKCDPNSCLHRALNGFECLPGVCIPGKCDVAKCFQQLKSNSMGTAKKKKSKLTKLFECQRGVCVPGKCDPYECLARLKILHGASAYSDDGQAFTQTMKGGKVNRKRVAGKETLYKEKGASTMPRNKMPLHMPNRDVVRIGSNCSFNIEFYKEKPNNLKALSQIECEPGVCIPKKCDPIDCYQRLQNMSKREGKSEGPKPGAKTSKRKAKKIKETSPTQSVVDNSDQKSSSPDQTSATQSKASIKSSKTKPPKKGIISLMKKCCKCKRKRKPNPDAIDDSQESISKSAKPKKQSKKKIIKKEAKRDPKEQSFERLDSEEDVVDTPPSVESPAKSAGTQSRKYPAREMMPRIKPPVKRNICECGAKILPPLADRIYGCIGRMLKARERKLKEEDYDIFVIEPNDCCCMGDVNNYCSEDVEEHGVVIGSCGGFNLKLTKNDTKTKNGSG